MSFKEAKILKKVKKYSLKSRWFTNHGQGNAYFTDHENFPKDGKTSIHESWKN